MGPVAERILNRRRVPGVALTLVLFALAFAPAAPAGIATPTADAERFAVLLEATAWRPSVRELDNRYLASGSRALAAFDASRIGGAAVLAESLSVLRPDYRRAVAHCLPAARALAPRLPALLDRVGQYLGRPATPEVRFLFGAGRSAGTVEDGTVVLALEVVCRFLDGAASAEALLEDFVVHEVVHVHQLATQVPGRRDSLLRQAMIEGFADYVAGEVLGRVPVQERERARYGRTHEKTLWAEFAADMSGTNLGAWMYGPGAGDRPPDLGYWIGKRICSAYVRASDDPRQALRDLLLLASPGELLEASGYDGAAPRTPGDGTAGGVAQ